MRSPSESEAPDAQPPRTAVTGWTTSADLKAQLKRLWERGDLLRSQLSDETLFPLRLALKAPGSADLAGQFDAVRAWIAQLAALPHLRIEWREIRHRVLGVQRLPQSVWVDALDAALAILGKRAEMTRFEHLVAFTRARRPTLLDWVAKRPVLALELAAEWERLLAVVDWTTENPHPGLYLRQVDIAGVHTKFIEEHRAVLTEMLDVCLSPQVIDPTRTGVSQFAARYGFRDKPIRIRFRVLDTQIDLMPGLTLPDITVDSESFSKLQIPVRRVFITENETNFLAFPPAAQSLVIFGSGYGWDALSKAKWLRQCTLFYWGDIDTHGFAILDQLRAYFGHVESFLMDRATLMAHEPLWGEEQKPFRRDLPHLTEPERALFNDLRDNRIRQNLRLEQEHLSFHWVETALTTTEVP